jgi:hypothetical protein
MLSQLSQVEGGPFGFKNQASGEATSLPATVIEWNATANEGYLRLKP